MRAQIGESSGVLRAHIPPPAKWYQVGALFGMLRLASWGRGEWMCLHYGVVGQDGESSGSPIRRILRSPEWVPQEDGGQITGNLLPLSLSAIWLVG